VSKRNNSSRGIHVLRDDVARKIAAGEVIDRPFSVVRELIDNSLDAESSEVSLSIEDGGISRIRVIDNGHGMGREDINKCFLPHATSKIRNVDDIYNIKTLGFRGEALSAIAMCSHLEIISATEQAQYGHRLLVHGGKRISLEESKSKKGTIVDVSSLFYNMPGRRKFLKSASGESYMCRTTFTEKALPFPSVAFKYSVNGKKKLIFPPVSLPDRVTSILGDIAPAAGFEYLEDKKDEFSVTIIAARPEIHRNDRKHIQTYINKRKIFEYGFVQAVEYGYSGYMPGKDHPVAYLFIEINPELVDFNIHPAKKECKIRILPQVRQCIVSMITSFAGKFTINVDKPETSFTRTPEQTAFENFSPIDWSKDWSVKQESSAYQLSQGTDQPDRNVTNDISKDNINEETETPKYFGQLFGLFLIAQFREKLFIIDQHAAHERILYEELLTKKHSLQDLLFPVSFDVTEEENEYIKSNLPALLKQGIKLEKTGLQSYEITALPAHFHSIDPKDIVSILKNSLRSTEEIEHRLMSLAACRNAIKDGDLIDHLTAQQLISRVFLLNNARCPHGRPIWHVISKEQLFKILGRK